MRMDGRFGRRSFRGFTLLEVLVVIGIIALLMSIAMPIGRRVKEEGRRVVCMANIGELGMAWSLYAAENNDMLCSAMTHFNDYAKSEEYELEGNTFNNWVADGPGLPFNGVANTEKALGDGVLWRYVEEGDVYKCPTDRRGLVRSYALSHTMGCESSYGETNYKMISQVKNSSGRLVFIDALAGSARQYDGTIHNLGSFDPIDTSRDLWMCGAMMLSTRHSGGSNMCFADMHCEGWKWEDKATLDFADGVISFSDFQAGSSVNKDLDRLKRLIGGM